MTRDNFVDMKKVQKEMNKMFESFSETFNKGFESFSKNFEKTFDKAFIGYREPLSDITQNAKEVKVNIELPGVPKKNVILKITNDLVEVRAEKRAGKEVKRKGFYKKEKSYKGFYRAIPLPTDVKADKAKAEFKDGILRIRIPKAKKKLAKKVIVK